MTLREPPAAWRRGFSLYRRQQGEDALGNETAVYDMDAPDETFAAEDGLVFQSPRSWNSGSRISAGSQVAEPGEEPGGILECCLRSELEIAPFDRLEIEGELWEVRSVRHWPGHRALQLQRVR